MGSRRRLVLPIGLALALSACADGSTQRADMLAEEIHQQQVEHFVTTFTLEAPTRAIRFAEERAHSPTIASLIEEGHLEFEDDAEIRELVTLLYAERDYAPVFVYGTQITPAGRQVIDLIADAYAHALNPEDYHNTPIVERVAVLASAENVDDIYAELAIDSNEEEVLLAFLLDNAALDETLPASDAVFQIISNDGSDNPLPDFAEGIEELTSLLEHVAASGPELELLLASGYLRYAREQRYSNLGYVSEELAEARGWDLEDETQRAEVERALIADSFRAMASADTIEEELAQLEPPFEQYQRLKEGIIEYTGYVEAGGWEPIETSRVWDRGDNGDVVVQLRRRLHAENYFDGDLESDEFDRDLERALEYYQQTHQLTEDGELDDTTLYSLNVPAVRRLAQIQVSMDRWRETRAAPNFGEEHIWVNIADFHAELWDENELVYRWRVVTGRTRRVNGEVRGRTPTFSDSMQYIVFNPYWNVPTSIRREEYDHLIEEDPKWLPRNNFEIYVDEESGAEILRQTPGPHNALGIVKFLFPNEHDVYMHDTPSRHLFERPTRAYSHGCIRVQDPLELAALLLMRDRDWDEERVWEFIEETMEPGTEEWVSLRTRIPIHIEYFVVRGDDDGRMRFLSDVYRYDRPLVREHEEILRENFGLEPIPEEEEDD